MSDNNIYSYYELCDEKYTGPAWNVYYEYGKGDEWWGHDGEFVDELDAWFKDLEAALAFANEYVDSGRLADAIYDVPAEGAESIMLSVTEYAWDDGGISWSGNDYFVRYDKDESGNVELTEKAL